jgi:alanyl-tRNA synthetase
MFSAPEIIDGIEVFTAKIDSTTPDALRSMGDDLKAQNDNAVAIIAGTNGEKATIVAICGKNAIAKGVKAGDVVREVAKLAGGGGGGRPDSAMAGAKDLSKLDAAVAATTDIVRNILG